MPQPTIARIESGKQMPRADTLDKLLQACGWELRLPPRRGEGDDRSLIRHWLDHDDAANERSGAPRLRPALEHDSGPAGRKARQTA